jgi:hypothetical protein
MVRRNVRSDGECWVAKWIFRFAHLQQGQSGCGGRCRVRCRRHQSAEAEMRRHDQMAPRDRDYNDTALLERSGAAQRGRLSALHNDRKSCIGCLSAIERHLAATRRRFARVSQPICWPRMMAAAAQRRLDHVFGVVIMAPWQNNTAHLHRPWRASSECAIAGKCRRSVLAQVLVIWRPSTGQ